MNGREAVAYIERYQWSATRLGLERTRTLLARLGDPQKKLRFIHVAGSNGKGSTCAMLDAVLRAAGYSAGLYTSPHLTDFCERIQINGRPVSPDRLARATEQVQQQADAMADHPSQFELATAAAMLCFADAGCDPVVLEVGMGGALDATNVIDRPLAAVITNVGLEHTEYLGRTLEEIAAAKGGIIKPGCPAVCYQSDPAVMRTLAAICRARQAAFVPVPPDATACLSRDLSGQTFRRQGQTYSLPLLGAHQLRNADVALTVVETLRRRGLDIPDAAVREGLRSVHWPARFEVLRRDPPLILDGGHNPQCTRALTAALDVYLPGQRVAFLLGVLADKAYETMLDTLAPYGTRFLCVTPDNPRALPAGRLCDALRVRGCRARACPSVAAGLTALLSRPEPSVVFGSLYMAGEVRRRFFDGEKKDLSD